ncbi:MAG: sensor domain-containing diguanylate cyclase, partial [Myxococcota bacterium]
GRWFAGALLGGAARLFAFRIHRRARIAVDSPIYISVAFDLGVLHAAWLVFFVLAMDGVVRTGWRVATEGAPGALNGRRLLERVYIATAPTLVMLVLGGLFRLNALPETMEMQSLLVFVPTFTASFLVLHYFAAGQLHWFDGGTSRAILREYFVRVVSIELFLIPLTVALIVALGQHGIPLFLLIGTMAVLFSAMYRSAVTTSASLDERVHELSVLNAVGRLLSRTLDRHSLLENLARESCRLVGGSSHFIIATPNGNHRAMHCEIYDAQGVLERSLDVPIDFGLVGRVFEKGEALRIDDLVREYSQITHKPRRLDERFNSWLGVPLVNYDEVTGVIAVESKELRAYDDDHVRVMSTIADQASVALENTKLYELATIDGLTGLFVRRYFDQRLEEELLRSRRYETDFSVGILDLDRFKRLNDHFGHQVGDQVLRAAARVVRENMRGADLAGRYGGEEFAFIFPRTELEQAALVAERIRADIEAVVVESPEGPVQVTASIGVASYPASGADGVEGLVALADRALYRAKERGRNRVELSTSVRGRALSLMTRRP